MFFLIFVMRIDAGHCREKEMSLGKGAEKYNSAFLDLALVDLSGVDGGLHRVTPADVAQV